MRRSARAFVLPRSSALAFALLATPLVAAQGSHLDYFRRLGGLGTDNAWDMAVDAAGNAWIAGSSDSRSHGLGDFDAFVVKLRPDGSVAWTRLLGGSSHDQASKVALDASGNAYIAGYTFSSDFQTTPGAFDESYNGGAIDAFAAKLGPDGALVYSTFLGGSSDDFGGGVTVDASGRAFITGYTESSDFPTTIGAFDTTLSGPTDIVVVALDPAGASQVYSTFVGGRGIEIGYDIAVDAAGSAVLTGQTSSGDFPTTPGGYQEAYGEGQADAFVVRVTPSGGELAYATYLGGTEFDDARGLALDSDGAAWVVGRTESFDYPTTVGAYDRSYNGGRDAFVSKLSGDGATLLRSTFVGGGGEEESGAVVLAPSGGVFVSGWTFSNDFPTSPQALDSSSNGNYDVFVIALDSALGQLDYATYLGSIHADYGRGIGTDAAGNAFACGYSGFENIDSFALKISIP
jgi:hypothetical protein